jgi:hypothetical protein
MKTIPTKMSYKSAPLRRGVRFGVKAKYFILGFAACFLLFAAALAAPLPGVVPTAACTDAQIASYPADEFYDADFFLINENCIKGGAK